MTDWWGVDKGNLKTRINSYEKNAIFLYDASTSKCASGECTKHVKTV
jgi:hypothetical protein